MAMHIGRSRLSHYGEPMLTTLTTILPVFLIILTGFVAGRSGVVPPSDAGNITRFVIWVPLPMLMFHIVATTDWRHHWHGDFALVLILSLLLMFLLGMMVGWLRGRPVADMALDGLNASFSNMGYLGLPMLLMALGPISGPYSVLGFSLVLSLLSACTILVIELGNSHGHAPGRAVAVAVRGVVTNPVLVPPLAGLAWWMTGWPLPAFLDKFMVLLGNAAPPVALAGIGLLLSQQPVTRALTNGTALALTVIKLIAAPAVAAALALWVFRLPNDVARMAILLAAMPTGTGPSMIAGLYQRNATVTSGAILLSTVASVLTITIILMTFPG